MEVIGVSLVGKPESRILCMELVGPPATGRPNDRFTSLASDICVCVCDS